MHQGPTLDQLFDPRIEYPDPEMQSRLAKLVGLDDHKERLTKILSLLVNPAGLEAWSATHHPDAAVLLDTVLRRPPLVVLAGDVGSGKTELAETIGDAVARQDNIEITLLPLSLSTRGQGRVGEMTQLLCAAFDHAVAEAQKLKAKSGKARGAVILLVDEADALAQSRESAQMHHEDRAGVNAFIRGIDRLASAKLPAAVLMCTNRLEALDPAVRRRAAEVLTFARPDAEQRRHVLEMRLAPLNISHAHIEGLVAATGGHVGHDVGFTYSDLTQRLIPAIVLDAYPNRPVEGDRAIAIARDMQPTPAFRAQA
jgi:SpoVK/Ycf46/Vps4 family AAA+-type ATPase